jgi:[ribosomal protein S5]-alanine N-acetyltransferase
MNAIIETDRLILREMEMSDLDFFAGLLSDLRVMRYYPKLYSRKEAQAALERQIFRYKLNGRGLWLMEDKNLRCPAGVLGLLIQVVDFKAEPEIGYMLHPTFWKRGYATEGGIATRDYAFNTLKLPHVISLIRPVNLPSQAVAKRLGMQLNRRTIFYNLEHLVFRIDRSEQ